MDLDLDSFEAVYDEALAALKDTDPKPPPSARIMSKGWFKKNKTLYESSLAGLTPTEAEAKRFGLSQGFSKI